MADCPEPLDAHRRSHARLRLGISAMLETLDGDQHVRLIDLSQSGAHLLVERPGKISRAVLSWLTFEAFGLVVWQDGGHIGVEFDELLEMEALLETRAPAPFVVRDRVIAERAAARSFVAGVTHQGSER